MLLGKDLRTVVNQVVAGKVKLHPSMFGGRKQKGQPDRPIYSPETVSKLHRMLKQRGMDPIAAGLPPIEPMAVLRQPEITYRDACREVK